jgi:hypothetical protein
MSAPPTDGSKPRPGTLPAAEKALAVIPPGLADLFLLTLGPLYAPISNPVLRGAASAELCRD